MPDSVLIKATTKPQVWLPNKVYYIEDVDRTCQYVTDNEGNPHMVFNEVTKLLGRWGFFRNAAMSITCQPDVWTNVPLTWATVGQTNKLPNDFADWFDNGKFKGQAAGYDYSLEVYVDCDQTNASSTGVMDFFVDNGSIEYGISLSNRKFLPNDAAENETFRSLHDIFIGPELFQFGAQCKVKFDSLVVISNLRFELRINYAAI